MASIGVCLLYFIWGILSVDTESDKPSAFISPSGLRLSFPNDKHWGLSPNVSKNIKRVLIIQLAGLGDMVMATSTIRAIRRLYPNARLCLLINSRSFGIMKDFPYLDEIFAFKGLGSVFRIIFKLRQGHFDLVINLYRLYSFKGSIKMFLLFLAINGRYWVGRDTQKMGFFYHLKIPENLKDQKHEIELQLDIARALGATIDDTTMELPIQDSDKTFITDFLYKQGVSENDILIGFNPGGFRPSRHWFTQRWAQLADTLAESYRSKVIIIADKRDAADVESIAALVKYPVIKLSDLTLPQLVALIARLNLFITDESGPMHIACAVKTPLVALFGPGEVNKFSPYPPDKRYVVIKKDTQCSPCYKFSCKKRECMSKISVDDVLSAVKTVLV
jgi:ADP-heptose:LPS heptosyltransferase